MLTVKDVFAKLNSGEITLEDVIAKGMLSPVTQRIAKIKQPYGGYINPKEFECIKLDGGTIDDLYPEENVHPVLIGITVDYLTRFMTGTPAQKAFEISQAGANLIHKQRLFKKLLKKVKGLDNTSIVSAVKLSGFDTVYRARSETYRPVKYIKPDANTIENIRVMVERSLHFFEQYGPKVLDGLTFEGGYTGYVAAGDGDFLTRDTLWDFKVSKKKPLSKHTLQLFMYWRMGLHSIYHEYYESVKNLGIYNPRMNVVYLLDVSKIPLGVIEKIEKEVIGY